MKIGDRVLIKGIVDEIRKDVVIIKNDGGYFGTVPSEIIDKYADQEPCDDAVSRQAVINMFPKWKFVSYEAYLSSTLEIEQLPSVIPQEPCDDMLTAYAMGVYAGQEPKTGHWIYICNSEVNGLKIVECSSCGKRTYGSGKYCPNCGCRMVEPQESECKECSE